MFSLILGDRKTSAVFEITTASVQVRHPERGLCFCTNHFRTKPLAVSTRCLRFEALEKARDVPKLSLADLAKRLHEANQAEATMQTMVFEPGTLKLHLSLGKGPTSARPLKVIELAPLLARKASRGPAKPQAAQTVRRLRVRGDLLGRSAPSFSLPLPRSRR
jgi:hypothetical protein